MTKIDVFAHVLLSEFYKRMLMLDPELPQKMPFIQNPVLSDMELRRKLMPQGVKQVISYVNANPEDYANEKVAPLLVKKANEELTETVRANSDIFYGGVAMLALNNIEASLEILEQQVAQTEKLLGVQLFTRHLGESVANERFKPIFAKCAELDLPIWLHPVFDARKPDNNIVFSWEYELTQAMYQIVEAGYFQEFPNLKIIIHHAGAMVPYFAGRIDRILPENLAKDFRKFYVDTAILGNTKALELAVDFFGVNRILFGTDAPLGIAPAGATHEIIEAIENMALTNEQQEAIFTDNFSTLLGKVK